MNILQKILLACLSLSSVNGLYAVDYTAELATVAALGTDAAMLAAPVMYADDTSATTTTVSAGERKAVYFAGLDYLGNPTRIYAWVGIPAGADITPVAGMVLVHGGGGTAHESWVRKWNERGFAAISIAVEGQTDSTATPVMNTGWHIHNMPGPVRAGIYNDTNVSPITDQWMYHAVAGTVLANSLLRSLPEVVDNDVGLSGYSWGGVITSTVIGIDARFKFAVPTYGCGHMFDARNAYGANLGNDEFYKQVWDPMVRIANATMPVLWFSWPEDAHFPLENQAHTYHGASGTRMVSLKAGMGHGVNFNSPETYDFADSIINGGGPWCVQQSLNLVGSTATVVFDSTKTLNSASLVYRTSNRPNITGIAEESPNPWSEIPADSLVESPAGTWTVTATLPAGVTGWFVNVKATGSDAVLYGYNDADITASSDYQEIIDLSPSLGVAIQHSLANNQSTGTVEVGYTGPGNVDVSSITISGESHAGAFSSLTAAPLVMLTPTPDTTPVTIQFDNTVAGLTEGQSATATLTIVWDELDGSTDQIALPLVATAIVAATVNYDASADWDSQNVNDIDHVVIQNDATVTVGEFVAPELIVNGSFETPDITTEFRQHVVGVTTLTGWTITDNNVFQIDGFDNNDADMAAVASDGDQFVQLQWNSSGSTLSQTIATVVGQTYRLEFDYGGIYPSNKDVTLTYNVGGGADQTIDYSLIDLEVGQVAWVTQVLDFTATATTTTVSFTGDYNAGFWGPGVDNVSVKKVASVAATADTITVNDDASPTTATLDINQNDTLTTTTSMVLGAGTGAGFVNQSTGTVTTAGLTINSSGTGDTSQYNLSGGALAVTNSLTVNAGGELNLTGGTLTPNVDTVTLNGVVTINGGTFTSNIAGVDPDFNGTGTLAVQSGSFSLTGGAATDLLQLGILAEVSGGTVDISGQLLLPSSGEFKVIGDAATINTDQFSSMSSGTFRFVFDATGVSPVNFASWMGLGNVSIAVDGSAYTGGETTFTLLDSTNFITLFDTNNLAITGFDLQGKDAYLTQDQSDGADWVQLVVEELLSNGVTKRWMRENELPETNEATLLDSDGDGRLNWEEFEAGTSPNDNSSKFVVEQVDLSEEQLTVYWQAVSGKTYVLQHKADLTDPLWTAIRTNLLGVEPQSSVTVGVSGTKGFYQISVE